MNGIIRTKEGNIARKVDKNHHDIVTGLLAENARKVFASNLADKFAVYSREKMIFGFTSGNE